MSKLTELMYKSLQEHLEEIKQKPFSEILEMPSYSDKVIKVNDNSFTLATWKNQQEDRTLEIVVQEYYTGWAYRLFGAGKMMADGFLIDSNGNISVLPDEIRWKYC